MAGWQQGRLLVVMATASVLFVSLVEKCSVAVAESNIDTVDSKSVSHHSVDVSGQHVDDVIISQGHSYHGGYQSYYNVSSSASSANNETLHSRHTRQTSDAGYRLTLGRLYFATASKYVRPKQIYKVHFELLYMPYGTLQIQATLIQNDKEYATTVTTFKTVGAKLIELQVPLSVTTGNHKLRLTGIDNTTSGQEIFRNETSLIFSPKYVSLFIETDKPIYYSRQQVYVKIVGVTSDMKPASGSMTIYVSDGKGNIFIRKREQQLKFGVYTTDFRLDHPFQWGEMTISINAFGWTYQKNFTAQLYRRRMYEVNLTLPEYILNTEWGMAGIIHGQHPSNMYSEGNATILVKARKADGTYLSGNITRFIGYLDSKASFEIPMTEMETMWGVLAGLELYVECSLRDWYYYLTRTVHTYVKVLYDNYVLKQIGRLQLAFKPNIPFTVHYVLQRSDGRPFSSDINRQVYISVTHVGSATTTVEDSVLVPDDAIIRYKITPYEDDRRVIIRAWYCLTPSYIIESIAYRHYSKNNKYISVISSSDMAFVNEYLVLTVRSNIIIPFLNYIISTNGLIYQSNTIEMYSMQKSFPIAVSRDMAPRSRILVYCYYEGEFLTDSLNVFVYDTILEAVYLKENWGKHVRRDEVEVLVEGEPGGFIALNGMDWELYSRNRHLLLDRETVTTEMESYDQNSEAPYQHIWWSDDLYEQSIYFNSPTAGLDQNTTYELGGFVGLSDQNLTIPEEHHQCNQTLGYARCLDGSCYSISKKCDGIVDCADGVDEAVCPARPIEMPVRRNSSLVNHIQDSQFFDNVNWAWITSYIQPNGRVQIPLKMPKSNLTFTIGGIAIHPVVGLQIVREPIRIDTTRTFYMLLEGPQQIKRGEQVGLRLALHNTWEERIESVITLHRSDDYRFVAVEDFGIVNSYAPRLISGDIQTMVELRPFESKYIFIPVIPVVLPETELQIRVSAYSPLDNDDDTLTITLLYEGATSDDYIVFLIDLVSQGSVLLPYFDSGIPQNYWDPTKRELLYVPGSNTVVASVFGDIVSPGFFEPYFTTSNTIGISDASAEGYMYNIAVNLEVLRFLNSVNSLRQSEAKAAMDYMQWALVRPYAYMRDDGAFREFWRTDEACLWITAFCFATLDGVAGSEWAEDVFVSPPMLNKIADWIVSTQRDDGAFPEVSTLIYSRNFLPTSIDENGVSHEWHIPVTAYVTTALAESKRITGNTKANAEYAILRATEYMAQKIDRITDPLQMAMMAYALHVAGHNSRQSAYERLKTMKRDNGEYVYWATNEIPPNPIIVIDTLQYLQRRPELPNEQNALMATSYALLLHLFHNEFEAARPIMKWIHTQHMGIMKYSSTVDTVLVLRALREYAYRETNRAFYNLEVTFEAGSDPSWKHVAQLNYTNLGIIYDFTLNEAWGPIKATARGTGYAYTQMQVIINHEKPYQTEDWGPDTKFYSFEIIKWHELGYNASAIYVEACLHWLMAEEITPETGLINLLITIPTGYFVPYEVMEQMYIAIPRCKQIRFEEMTLIIFLDFLNATQLCFDFTMYRQFPIANGSIPQLFNVYEYSETGLQLNSIYTTYSLFHLHVCHVCASFQCPFCGKYYNGASHVTTTYAFVTLFAAVALITAYARHRMNFR